MRECCLPSLLIALKCRMDGLSVVFRCLSYIWRDAAAAVHPSISFSFFFFLLTRKPCNYLVLLYTMRLCAATHARKEKMSHRAGCLLSIFVWGIRLPFNELIDRISKTILFLPPSFACPSWWRRRGIVLKGSIRTKLRFARKSSPNKWIKNLWKQQRLWILT